MRVNRVGALCATSHIDDRGSNWRRNIDQHRVGEAEFLDAASELRDLIGAARPGIPGIPGIRLTRAAGSRRVRRDPLAYQGNRRR
jgi:hypothetical protein